MFVNKGLNVMMYANIVKADFLGVTFSVHSRSSTIQKTMQQSTLHRRQNKPPTNHDKTLLMMVNERISRSACYRENPDINKEIYGGTSQENDRNCKLQCNPSVQKLTRKRKPHHLVMPSIKNIRLAGAVSNLFAMEVIYQWMFAYRSVLKVELLLHCFINSWFKLSVQVVYPDSLALLVGVGFQSKDFWISPASCPRQRGLACDWYWACEKSSKFW